MSTVIRAIESFHAHPDRPGIVIIERWEDGFDRYFRFAGFDGSDFKEGIARLAAARHVDAAPEDFQARIEDAISRVYAAPGATCEQILDALSDTCRFNRYADLTI